MVDENDCALRTCAELEVTVLPSGNGRSRSKGIISDK